MATSGTATFTITGAGIVSEALLKGGITNPTATQSADGLRALNLMAQAWRGKGLKTWARSNQSVTMVADTTSYTIGPSGDVNIARPTRVLGGYLTDSSGIDTPVTVISRQEYNDISDKDASGVTTLVFYDPQDPVGVLYPWPVLDTSGYTLTLDIQKRIEDFSAGTDTPDFPSDWFEALALNLWLRLAPHFGKKVSESFVMLARESLAVAEGTDFEATSIYMVPSA